MLLSSALRDSDTVSGELKDVWRAQSCACRLIQRFTCDLSDTNLQNADCSALQTGLSIRGFKNVLASPSVEPLLDPQYSLAALTTTCG